jgi:SAM-dependent methyltransferase
MTIEPDTKDWTWVLDRPCPDCGFDAAGLDLARLPRAIRDNAVLWQVVLATDDAAVRPAANVWSPLEYACHVRDVDALFAERVERMLAEDNPVFDDWDQDETAVESDYGSQDPAAVAAEVVAAAELVAAVYERVVAEQWARPGTRSNGSAFTVDTLARYHLHDLVHHAHDVSHVTQRITVDSYDTSAEAYATGRPEPTADQHALYDGFAGLLETGARVLEVGSGPGRDAEELERRGLSVRRTDISPGFVRLLRAAGHDADVVDPLVDDLTDPDRDAPYDGVWASASLLHVRREHLPTVLSRLAAATRDGGVLHLAVKEGDGARFSVHGHVSGPRHFTFWRGPALRAVLDQAGWDVRSLVRHDGRHEETWLDVTALRR